MSLSMPEPILDISWGMHPGMTLYPGNPAPKFKCMATVAQDGSAMQGLELTTHTGTHLDAPAHFVHGGLTIDQIPLDVLCGPVLVMDVREVGLRIEPEHLQKVQWAGVQRVLFRTSNESLLEKPGQSTFAALTEAGARFLIERTQVRLVGIDYTSIECSSDGSFPVHHLLLGATSPVIILEGLDLRRVPAGIHELYCMPLPLVGMDGSPCRAALRLSR